MVSVAVLVSDAALASVSEPVFVAAVVSDIALASDAALVFVDISVLSVMSTFPSVKVSPRDHKHPPPAQHTDKHF